MFTTNETVYPAEFIGSLYDNARRTLEDYLTDNGAPAEATRLFNDTLLLQDVENRMRAGEVTPGDLQELGSLVLETAKEITLLGGTFAGGDSRIDPA